MKSCLCWLLCLMSVATAWADPVRIPLGVTIVGPAAGDGSRGAPFVFACGAKGKLAVTTEAESITWVLDDAPTDTEVLPGDRLLWFPTDSPGLYVVYLSAVRVQPTEAGPPSVISAGARCWIEIKPPDGPTPAPVKKSLSDRLRAALTGPDARADSIKLEGSLTALAEALEQQKIRDTGQMESALQAALEANHWPTGRYPQLGKLLGELFGEDVPVKTFTAELREQTIRQLREVAAACRVIRGA